MRCLVTGATGFLGQHLCRRLLQEEAVEVRATGRKQSLGFTDQRLAYVACDLEQVDHCANALFDGVDTVFYLAGMAHNKAGDEALYRVNVILAEHFMKVALDHGVKRFVYVSSSKAVAQPGAGPATEESAPAAKTDAYGYSKWCAEQKLLSMKGFEHVAIVRPCLIYGEGVQGNIASLIRAARKNLLPGFPDTGARRSMVSAEDVADAIWLVAMHAEANRQVYLLSDSHEYCTSDIVNAIYNALGKKPVFYLPASVVWLFACLGELVHFLFRKFPFSMDTYQKLFGPALYSSRKIREQLGWQSRYSFDDSVKKMVNEKCRQAPVKGYQGADHDA